MWQAEKSISASLTYDSRIYGGALGLVARQTLPAGAVLRGTMVYAAAM